MRRTKLSKNGQESCAGVQLSNLDLNRRGVNVLRRSNRASVDFVSAMAGKVMPLIDDRCQEPVLPAGGFAGGDCSAGIEV